MKIELGTVRESPFVGIFSLATDKAVFVPKSISSKERKKIESLFGLEIIKASIANSTLLGVLSAGNSNGIVSGSILSLEEEKELGEKGIRVKRLENVTAVGNLLAVNDSKGICSALFSEKQAKGIEKFLGVKLMKAKIAGTDVVGAGIVLTNKGFVLNKMASQKEGQEIEKHLGIPGAKGTVNAGDCFVGNSAVANSDACLAGQATTGFELARLDTGLRG